MRKFASILLAAVTALSLLPLSASAQEPGQKKGFFHRFNVGLTAVDFGYCPSTYEGSSSTKVKADFYYDLGVSLKYGDYLSPVQVEAGVLPGLIFRKKDLVNDDDLKNDFRLISFAKVKANICDAFNGSKFYVAGSGFYNIIDKYELNVSGAVSVGIAWKSLDCSLFFKMPIGDTEGYPKCYVGTTVSFYFGL